MRGQSSRNARVLGWSQLPRHGPPAQHGSPSCAVPPYRVSCRTGFPLAHAECRNSPFPSEGCCELPSTFREVLRQRVACWLDLRLSRVRPALCFICTERKAGFSVSVLRRLHFTKAMQSAWTSWKTAFPGSTTLPEEAFPKDTWATPLLIPSDHALVPQPDKRKQLYPIVLQAIGDYYGLSHCRFQVI